MIQFYRGLKSSYNYPSALLDAIFFATDTGEILVNGVNYSVDSLKIKDVTFVDNVFTFTKADDSTLVVDFTSKLLSDEDRAAVDNLKEALEGAGFTANYETTLDPDLATTYAVGGIPAGTKVSAYKDRPLSRVIDDLLFPTIQPTVTAVEARLSLRGETIRAIGTPLPSPSDFTATWIPGTIKIGNKIQNTRAGAKQSEKIYLEDPSHEVVAGEVTQIGEHNYYCTIEYAEGPVPLDSKGNASTKFTALPAGSTTSSPVTVYGVYPFFATLTDNDIANGSISLLPLTNHTIFTCTLAAESATSKQVIMIPYTITKIELKDPFGNWANQPLESFVKTTDNLLINSNPVTYNVYTRNQGQNGATEFRITYSK